MANEVPNKIEYGGRTLIDLTGDTATESDVAVGKTFHLASGVQSVGTRSSSYYITTESPNSIGTAVVGDAETDTPNYTPSGDIRLIKDDVVVVDNVTASLNWNITNNFIYIMGVTQSITTKNISVPMDATFEGNGVTLLVKEETE